MHIYTCAFTIVQDTRRQEIAIAMNPEPPENQRELTLQRKREQDRAHHQSELAQQHEERLRRRRKVTELHVSRGILAQRRDRLITESAQDREARLQKMSVE